MSNINLSLTLVVVKLVYYVKEHLCCCERTLFFSDDLVSLLRLRINMTAIAPPESYVEQQTRESNGGVQFIKIKSISLFLSNQAC